MRAEATQILHNVVTELQLQREDEHSMIIRFADVEEGIWYEEAVNDGYKLQLLTGNDDGTFTPSRNLNRAEAAVMMQRLKKLMEMNEAI